MPTYNSEPAFGGKNIFVSRVVGGVATKLVMITTKEKTSTYEYDDASIPDPNNPGKTVQRRSYKKMSSKSFNISGIAGMVEFGVLEADAGSDSAVTYRFELVGSAINGGGYWEGAVFFENLQLQSQKNGVAEFSAQLRVDGALPWTQASA